VEWGYMRGGIKKTDMVSGEGVTVFLRKTARQGGVDRLGGD
jgi:hypothetical protein